MIKVLIVEDSLVKQKFIEHILTSDPAIQVVGFAIDGSGIVDIVKENRPDVITMDIHMRYINGFEATRMIMENVPTPIVILSASTSVKESASIFKAFEAGALSAALLPPGILDNGYERSTKELIQTVKLMSEVKVVRLRSRKLKELATVQIIKQELTTPKGIRLIAIGASTGGPNALLKILSSLPLDLPVPILIVQHISTGFVGGFVEWLSAASHFPVHIATHGLRPLPGHGYVAPDGLHMAIEKGPYIVLSELPSENGLRPSINYLFRTVEQVMGQEAIGILLTGMGRDGAQGLKKLKDSGAITIAQDRDSSIVFGMPGEAVKIDAASYVLPLEEISDMIVKFVKKSSEEN